MDKGGIKIHKIVEGGGESTSSVNPLRDYFYQIFMCGGKGVPPHKQ